MSSPARFRALRIHNDADGYRAALEEMSADELTPGEVLVKTAFSSINYKDALAGTGKGKILRRHPLNGGIDAAGYVAASTDPAFREGDAVLCTGCGLSETRDGGYGEYVKLESQWAIPLPAGLTLRESMILGTAGFTAALAVFQLIRNGQTPDMGPIVVTGATGGVGMLAIDILTRAGFEAQAITGKADQFDFLIGLGATQCIARKELYWGQRPLEAAHWGGAIDNVGGDMLSGLTRVIRPYGAIATCGNAGGAELATTVMPFILRGLSVLGVASTGTARPIRDEIWQRLAGDWKPQHLETIATGNVTLDELGGVFETMLGGDSFGRKLVTVG
ncbi:MAG TPA: acryloyl-CoA reductase [Dokdonella sp.]|uniref:acrylyl-CoA reductase family protein n=1 Tax=Dokdonella sp. TaxID=2291710 RepID=UPI002BB89EAB|nr:acryloyl-CoA reductase [Dokdonella sp.]HUD40978.1 acryloyl-CoA reductase [Dokdonella sp.]